MPPAPGTASRTRSRPASTTTRADPAATSSRAPAEPNKSCFKEGRGRPCPFCFLTLTRSGVDLRAPAPIAVKPPQLNHRREHVHVRFIAAASCPRGEGLHADRAFGRHHHPGNP